MYFEWRVGGTVTVAHSASYPSGIVQPSIYQFIFSIGVLEGLYVSLSLPPLCHGRQFGLASRYHLFSSLPYSPCRLYVVNQLSDSRRKKTKLNKSTRKENFIPVQFFAIFTSLLLESKIGSFSVIRSKWEVWAYDAIYPQYVHHIMLPWFLFTYRVSKN